MPQAGFFALRQIHYARGEIVDPDRGAKFVVYDSDGQAAAMAVGEPVQMPDAAIV